MLKPGALIDIETHKILWDFEIQARHLIPTKKYSQF